MRCLTALLATGIALLGAVANADAAGLVYIDADHDVAVARPDGSFVKKVTHAADAAHGYKAVSVADDGGITAFLAANDDRGNSSFAVFDQGGAVRQGPFLFERSGLCGGLSPFRTATSPDGVFVAVQYWKGSNNCLGGGYTPSVRITARNTPTIGTSTYPSYDYLTQPAWIRHPDQRLAGINGSALQVWQNDAAHMRDWITVSGGLELDGFDVHPTQTKLLLDVADASGSGVKPHTLALLTYTELSAGGAAPTDPAPQLVCAAEGYVANDTGGGRPVWSPDGSQIAWRGVDGIYVSPAPVPSGDACVLQPKLVVPGGTEPRWAAFDVTAPAPPTDPGGGGTPPGGGAAPPPPKPSAGPAAFTSARAAAARRAFTLSLKLPKAAKVTVTVYRKGAKKALGKLTYKAGKGTFKRRITNVGGHRLKQGAYRVVVAVGATTKTLSVSVRG
ncbi:MAG TPA: hypothetical protein VNS09_22560 [Solirubrobacter sp.]|nr:hypothetical protein [Solirubrobacter sp.]